MNNDPKPKPPDNDLIEDDDPFGVDEGLEDDGSLDIEEEKENWVDELRKVGLKPKEKNYE